MTPDGGLTSSLFSPLFALAALYVVVYAAGAVVSGRGGERGESLKDWAFAVMLLTAAYTAFLLLLALVQKLSLFGDLLTIIITLCAFFGVLLVGLLAVFDLGIGGISRVRRRASRDDA